jgi:hypothetical protein
MDDFRGNPSLGDLWVYLKLESFNRHWMGNMMINHQVWGCFPTNQSETQPQSPLAWPQKWTDRPPCGLYGCPMIFPSRGRFMAASYCLIWNLTLGQSVQLVDSLKPPEIYLSSGINMPFLRMKSIFLKPHESTNQSCKPMTSTLLFPRVSVSLGGATLWPPQWGQWELLLLPAMPAIRMPSICMACLAMCPVNSQLLADQTLTLTLTQV